MMDADELEGLTHRRRVRDLIDRDFASPLDVPTMASRALMSPAHFSRRFKAAYGETPYAYLMTRRIERAMALLRGGVSVTDACMGVGWTSLGLAVLNDVAGGGRWVTLGSAFPGGAEIVFSDPHAGRSEQDGNAMQELLAKGVLPMTVFTTDDVDALSSASGPLAPKCSRNRSTSRGARATVPSATSRGTWCASTRLPPDRRPVVGEWRAAGSGGTPHCLQDFCPEGNLNAETRPSSEISVIPRSVLSTSLTAPIV